jgi:hypothetical protein
MRLLFASTKKCSRQILFLGVEDGVDASRRSLLRHALRSLGRAGVLIRVAVGKPPFCQPFDLRAEEEGADSYIPDGNMGGRPPACGRVQLNQRNEVAEEGIVVFPHRRVVANP